jgi:nitronate monooxygenase
VRFKTPLCDLLSIELPILQAGMGKTHGTPTSPALVASVSEAGGLGCLGAAGLDPDELSAYLTEIKALTGRPFAVDLLLPSGEAAGERTRADIRAELASRYPRHVAFMQTLVDRYGLDETVMERRFAFGSALAARQLEVVLDHHVPVLVIGLGDPGEIGESARRAGVKVMALAGSPGHARRHVSSGVDAVIAQGHEAGGHVGTISTFPLLPAVVDAVSPVPVVAAGGIADGRGLVAALALGAQAVWCGTLFLYAVEADVAPEQRTQLTAAGSRDLVVSRCYTGKPARVVRTTIIDDWAASGLDLLPMPHQHVLMDDFVEAAQAAGRWELINNPAGQVAANLTEHRPAAQIVADLMRQADQVLDEIA